MKIVIATPFYPPEIGVLGMYAAGIQEAFERLGHEVEIVSFGAVRHLPPLIRHIAYFKRVRAAARHVAFVLALDTWSVGLPALFAAKREDVPFLVRVGGDFLWESYVERTKEPVRLSEFYLKPRGLSLKERLIRKGIERLVRDADALLFNTRFLRDLWQRAYHVPAEKANIVENFVPPTSMNEPSLTRVFVCAGRNIALKNRETLERAFKRAKEKYPKIELDMRLLPPAEHAARMARCYAVIIPSISEVSSNTAIDAISAGKPFIMTDDTGTKERLGECGLFIDTRSEDALVGAIETLLNPENYEYHRARIKEFSFTHSWDEMAREILKARS
ncbi:MAG TPA: glycosyltransferase family 4 protein [Candidatus Paceibacterota bacterium]|nr:glycosyltransferase family 4 protein [Candidatus Paceibacterota bacterium]